LHLSFHDDRVAGTVGFLDGFVNGVRWAAGTYWDVITGEVLLALVFEEVHEGHSLSVAFDCTVDRFSLMI